MIRKRADRGREAEREERASQKSGIAATSEQE